jgi:hypothetical protein
MDEQDLGWRELVQLPTLLQHLLTRYENSQAVGSATGRSREYKVR